MKKTKILLMVMLIMISCVLNISAQEELPRYQVYSLGYDLVKSSMIPEYEETLKEYISLFAEANYPYSLHMYSTNDFYYYYVTPIKPSYSELDSIRKQINLVYKNNPEKWDATFKKFEGTYEYYRRSVIYLDRELSYKPENPRLKDEEEMYSRWVFTYVKVGKTKEFKELIMKYKEIYKNNNISMGYQIFIGGDGTEEPLYIWQMNGKDAADFWAQVNLELSDLGEEAKLLRDEIRKLTRKIEIKDGWYRPKFSYIPEKK